MGETLLAVSLNDGITSKTFAAEVTGRLGQPLKGVDVYFSTQGNVSLAAGGDEYQYRGFTDGLGRVAVVLNRSPEHFGHAEGQLHVHCPVDDGSIQMRFVCMTTESRRS